MCKEWLIRAYPEDSACVGLTFQENNEPYFLPFTLRAWVIE